MRKLYGVADPDVFANFVRQTAQNDTQLDLPENPTGVAAGQIADVLERLRHDGVAVLDAVLPKAICDELEAVARAASCVLVDTASGETHAQFDEDSPLAVRYDLEEMDILASPAAQRLIADESLLAIAQGYLGAAPVQDLVAMWWSAAMGSESSDAAAQRFHFDLDRMRFLKMFVFLTDVDVHNGPHAYIAGSHREKPWHLRQDGRHSDSAVLAAFPDRERVVTGPRGTVFLADTAGLHKGKALDKGHRLLFQTEYATSLFGSPFTRPSIDAPAPELASMAARYPTVFERFHFGGID